MSKVTSIVTMIFILIGIYLFLARGKETVNIINSIAANSVAGIKVLQGRG